MKRKFLSAQFPVLAGLAFCAFLLSFSPANRSGAVIGRSLYGGEGFEIYINNKLVLQQFGKDMNTVKTITLKRQSDNDQLAIRYFHCGKAGKNRMVTIKNDNNRILKLWKFEDSRDAGNKMCCSVKEIMALPRLKPGTGLHLYYASSELPAGRELATVKATGQGSVQP